LFKAANLKDTHDQLTQKLERTPDLQSIKMYYRVIKSTIVVI